jgi:hypothetical protein
LKIENVEDLGVLVETARGGTLTAARGWAGSALSVSRIQRIALASVWFRRIGQWQVRLLPGLVLGCRFPGMRDSVS